MSPSDSVEIHEIHERWAGVVQSTSSKSFVADMIDLQGSGFPTLRTFSLDDVSEKDLPVVPGKRFVWVEGYEGLPGRRWKFSRLEFGPG